MSELVQRYRDIRDEVAMTASSAGRDPMAVKLVAVSKTHSFEKIRELYLEGHRDFGENYSQELFAKAAQAKAEGLAEIRWHFIGHLQTNKIKTLVPWVTLFHGVNSVRVFEEIEKRAEGRKLSTLIEVNIDGEESKSGVRIAELRELAIAAASFPSVEVRGLMVIPDPTRAEGARPAFKKVAELASELGRLTRGELSMGMTSDFKDAIAEGATYVRIGTAIFGDRSPREKL